MASELEELRVAKAVLTSVLDEEEAIAKHETWLEDLRERLTWFNERDTVSSLEIAARFPLLAHIHEALAGSYGFGLDEIQADRVTYRRVTTVKR